MRLIRNSAGSVAEQPGHPLLFCAGPVAASPRRARGVSPLQPRRLGCTPLRSARVPCGPTRADATGHQLALRDAQASRAPLRHEERDASWRVRGGRVQKSARLRPPASHPWVEKLKEME
jgi:hypothetical protein